MSSIFLFTVQDDIQHENSDEDDSYDQVSAEDLIINTSPHTGVNARKENIGPESTEIITCSRNPYYALETSNETVGGNIDSIVKVYLSWTQLLSVQE